MRIWIRTTTAVTFAAAAAWLTLSMPNAVQAQTPAAAKGKGKGFAQDPRAQTRTYHFEDTNEDLPYSLYVSSKVKKDQKAPLEEPPQRQPSRPSWELPPPNPLALGAPSPS